ncbi:hypothetical protein ABEY53_22720, partial [Bacillus mycoides]
MTQDAVRKGFQNLRDAEETYSYYVTTQLPHGGFFNFTSFICLPFVNTEYIKQCGGDNMVDRKVILNAYKKGPEAVI